MTTQKMTAFGAKAEQMTQELEKRQINIPAFGIDLGTTNSCIALIQSGNAPTTITLRNGKKTMPSCIMWKGKPGEFIVGEEAAKVRHKRNVVYSIKRLMGSDEKVTLQYGTKKLEMTPVEVSAEILKGLVEMASEQYKDIKDVVITVPARFNNRQIEDTKKAGELAGLNVIGILREPTAAVLVYDVSNKANEDVERTVICYDLGGGTFDASKMRLKFSSGDNSDLADVYGLDLESEGMTDSAFSKLYTVLETTGDPRLGGDDIDLELYKIFEREFRRAGYDPTLIPREEKERLIHRLEHFKVMGVGNNYGLVVNFKLKGKDGKPGERVKVEIPISSAHIREATEIIYRKTKAFMDKIINPVELRKESGEIVLVGGSTKSQVIRECLERDYPGIPISYALNPDESVALGAAIKAKETKFGDTNVEIYDVIPLAIGVVSDGQVSPMIKENQRVPFTARKKFGTRYDDQDRVQVRVMQGPSRIIEENFDLGELIIDGIPKKPAGEVTVWVVLSVDTNGLLKCAAEIQDVGRKELTLVNLFGGKQETKKLSTEERRIVKWKRLADTLSDEGRAELLQVIEQYKDGQATVRDVAGVVNKYMEETVEVSARPVTHDRDNYLEG